MNCTKTNPKPPCETGYELSTKKLKNGKLKKCCYKIKKSKKKKKRKTSDIFSVHDSLMEFNRQYEIRKESDIDTLLKRYPKGVFVSEKFDGHRMLFEISKKIGFSRTGKTTFNLPLNWKEVLCESNYALDGELFLPGFPASQVSSLRSDSDVSRQLWTIAEYHIFDIPQHTGTFEERLVEQKEIIKKINSKWNKFNKTKCPIQLVNHKLLTNKEDILKFYSKIINQKSICPILFNSKECTHPCEGIVISGPEKLYEFAKSKNKIKYKAHYDLECVVMETHPIKLSVKCYRLDCPKPPDENACIFNLSIESTPKDRFKAGDILKYTCMGYTKGNFDCSSDNKPKMPKFLDFRSEEICKENLTLTLKKKTRNILPVPKDGPNEKLAQYFDKVAAGYFKLKQISKALAYKKYVNITRRTTVKINLDNYFEVYGKQTSFGKQAKCFLENNLFSVCVGNRLDDLLLLDKKNSKTKRAGHLGYTCDKIIG